MYLFVLIYKWKYGTWSLEFILLICSDLSGDRPRPLPTVKEFKGAVDITERKGDPSWDFDVSVVY
jgi:hypothetical protein